MLRVLLSKDLRRAWRNPLPWLINLIVPLAMTALIGLVFGGNSGGGGLGKIRFAVVNENNGRMSDFLRHAISSTGGDNSSGIQLDPIFTNRAAAMREINANKISAILIIPTNFLSNYLLGRDKDQEPGGVRASGGTGGRVGRDCHGDECHRPQFSIRVSGLAGGG
jgi:uncharacterized phage infection (PIP) family protein YhgE